MIGKWEGDADEGDNDCEGEELEGDGRKKKGKAEEIQTTCHGG